MAMTARNRCIQGLFGLTAGETEQYPGINTFCDFLESQFEGQFRTFDDRIWVALNRPKPSNTDDFWSWCADVCRAFNQLRRVSRDRPQAGGEAQPATDNLEPTMHDVLREILPTRSSGGTDATDQQKVLVANAVLKTLCSLSTAITLDGRTQPRENRPGTPESRQVEEGTANQVSLTIPNHPRDIIWHGPLSSYVRTPFQDYTRELRRPEETDVGNDALYESSLTYASLRRFGAIKIVWVETLKDHLVFDEVARTLSIFRFPSVCVVRIKKPNAFLIDKNITNWTMNPNPFRPENDIEDHGSLYREALLSYRLLFGQSGESRKLLSRELKTHRARGALVDPFLDQLSSCRWSFGNTKSPFESSLLPESLLDDNGGIMDWPTYSRVDFPFFENQLRRLQEYGNKHPPTGFWEYFSDRRYPRERFAAQAAVVIGAMSIILSAGQLAVAIVGVT